MDDKYKFGIILDNRDIDYGSSYSFDLRSIVTNAQIACVTLTPFPKCCGVACLSSLYMPCSSEAGKLFLDSVIAFLEANEQYSKLFYFTQKSSGRAERLVTYGWEPAETFFNARSLNDLYKFEIDVSPAEEDKSKNWEK